MMVKTTRRDWYEFDIDPKVLIALNLVNSHWGRVILVNL